MRIAMIGTKGIPAKWGGIEKYVEEVGKRLVQRGHEVTVFGSRWYCGEDRHCQAVLGMKVRSMPTLHLQSTDALINAFLSSLLITRKNYDIVHFHGYASYYFIPLLKRFGKKTIVTAHGVESGWENPKYGVVGRNVIQHAFCTAMTNADCVTTVAHYLAKQIQQMFGINSIVAPAGIEEQASLDPEIIKTKYNLNGLDYVLFLGRIDPIKRIEWILDLLSILPEPFKIVIAGGAQNAVAANYYRQLKEASHNSERCIFAGAVTGPERNELFSNCLFFVSPSRNEGLPLTLLEAMSFGRCCIASNIPAHEEIIQDRVTGFLFDTSDKSKFLETTREALALPLKWRHGMGVEARVRVKGNYSWEKTVDLLERTYEALSEGEGRN